MSRATVEEFQNNPGGLLAAVEKGEQIVIERGGKAVARLLPAEDESLPDSLRDEWGRSAMGHLARAYGPSEPDYSTAAIIERISEATLAEDWQRPEEDAAWAHLQPGKSS
ncbi:MAG TPA: type II toxin-antitoxin system prevent-host-death family antitoxin [Candidatus Acidoferrum sp.]|nr:type II toxin-antitoxin system prevent-host-death family antitoxin [Candidatus Acidoferrum sp.]